MVKQEREELEENAKLLDVYNTRIEMKNNILNNEENIQNAKWTLNQSFGKLNQMKICLFCKAEIDQNSLVCPECGYNPKDLLDNYQNDKIEKRFCEYCGKRLSYDSETCDCRIKLEKEYMYCLKCNTKIVITPFQTVYRCQSCNRKMVTLTRKSEIEDSLLWTIWNDKICFWQLLVISGLIFLFTILVNGTLVNWIGGK